MWPMEVHLLLSAYLGSELPDQGRALLRVPRASGHKINQSHTAISWMASYMNLIFNALITLFTLDFHTPRTSHEIFRFQPYDRRHSTPLVTPAAEYY